MQFENEPSDATTDARRRVGTVLELLDTGPGLLRRPDLPSSVCDRRRTFVAALSWGMTQIMEGFALCGASMHPEVGWPPHENENRPDHREDSLRFERSEDWRERPTSAVQEAFRGTQRWSGLGRYIERPQQRRIVIHPIDLDEFTSIEPERSKAAWSAWVLSMLAMPWSVVQRAVETRQSRAALRALDDRTLSDIGVSRHEIDHVVRFGRDRR
jgi:uncharacterized protein YjiS (DUF1127 family)